MVFIIFGLFAENKITEIIKKHSSYITYPILLYKLVSREEEIEQVDQVEKVDQVEQ